MLRLASWNVNGLRAVVRKGCAPWTVLHEHDVVCLQEVKAKPAQLDANIQAPGDGWTSVFHAADKAGYSGVAAYSRVELEDVLVGVGCPEVDAEGRVLTVLPANSDLSVTCVYMPVARDAERLRYKVHCCAQVEELLGRLRAAGRRTVLLGDLNIAHRDVDVFNVAKAEGPWGITPEERGWFERMVADGRYVDVWRMRNPRTRAFTWFKSAGARNYNIGWRIDYALVEQGMLPRVRDVRILSSITGSDHCPVAVSVDRTER